ncbi:hypothetical protein [Mesorhizobium sp. YR577]|uniref:hypothetical protein n=1 Tax=Mesorhizobium sp. YR577 TaxID=1884373 RepID=UPI000B81DF90|nr:hypothetical protein [Mesorhizobium sp. YR577]
MADFCNCSQPCHFYCSIVAQPDKEVNDRLDELFGQHDVYHTFSTNLKKAVSAGDKNAISAMVDYPITVSIGGKNVKIKSGKDFVSHYDHIFSNKIVSAIEKQNYGALFANDQGIMIDNGEIWIDGIASTTTARSRLSRSSPLIRAPKRAPSRFIQLACRWHKRRFTP